MGNILLPLSYPRIHPYEYLGPFVPDTSWQPCLSPCHDEIAESSPAARLAAQWVNFAVPAQAPGSPSEDAAQCDGHVAQAHFGPWLASHSTDLIVAVQAKDKPAQATGLFKLPRLLAFSGFS